MRLVPVGAGQQTVAVYQVMSGVVVAIVAEPCGKATRRGTRVALLDCWVYEVVGTPRSQCSRG
eukprot:11066406-Alexandrium_andersonii.AAC.1